MDPVPGRLTGCTKPTLALSLQPAHVRSTDPRHSSSMPLFSRHECHASHHHRRTGRLAEGVATQVNAGQQAVEKRRRWPSAALVARLRCSLTAWKLRCAARAHVHRAHFAMFVTSLLAREARLTFPRIGSTVEQPRPQAASRATIHQPVERLDRDTSPDCSKSTFAIPSPAPPASMDAGGGAACSHHSLT